MESLIKGLLCMVIFLVGSVNVYSAERNIVPVYNLLLFQSNCGPPSALTASKGNAAIHAIFLDWSPSSCAKSYHVHALSSLTGKYEPLTTDPITGTSADITQVPANVYRFFKVSSADSSGQEGRLSDYAVGWSPSPVPLNVQASRGESDTWIRLSWDVVQLYWDWPGFSTVSYAVEYDLWYSTSKDGTYTKFHTVYRGEYDATDPFIFLYNSTTNLPDVTSGNHLYFKVTAVYYDDFDLDKDGNTTEEFESALSAPAEGWTLKENPPAYLSAPAWINATDGELCKIVISWASVAGATSYNVYRSPSPLAPTWTFKYKVTGTTVTEFVTSNLNVMQFTGYFYTVVPVDYKDVEGYSSPSDGGFAASGGPTGCY